MRSIALVVHIAQALLHAIVGQTAVWLNQHLCRMTEAMVTQVGVTRQLLWVTALPRIQAGFEGGRCKNIYRTTFAAAASTPA
jgi:hypothetical protein